ncbi:hypothetical protein HK102_000304 [Quaeritorhiza haematococci]|nr:hypothetical protein HK102_000304 [Quaeritorhiza haematococci]
MDVDQAKAETLRLVFDEKIDIFVGDVNQELTSAVAPLLDYASLLHCSSTSNTVTTEDKNALTTIASPSQYGMAALHLLSILPVRDHIAFMYEDTPDCQVVSVCLAPHKYRP